MSLKKSDQPPPLRASGWWETAKANLPLPVLFGIAIAVGLFVEGRTFGAYNQRVVMLIGFNIILAVSLQLINGFSGQFSLGHAGFMAVGAYMAAYPAITFSQGLSNPAGPMWFYLTLLALVGAIGTALLLVFWAMRKSRALHPSAPMVFLLLLLAWLLIDFSNAQKYAEPPARFVWTNLVNTVTALFNSMLDRGQPVASKVSLWLPGFARWPVCFLVLVIGGGSCAAVVGLIVGMPALRLRGDYLAIATLGMAEIIRILIQNAQPLGGALGLTSIPKATNFAWLYGFAIVTIAVIWRVAYSSKGRAIMAVREDEIAASAVGIDTTHHKVLAFIIGSFFGGVAGALYALHERSIAPYQFGLARSIEIVVMVTLGGLGSISGAVLAAIVLTVLLELLRDPPSLWPWGWVVVIVVVAALFAITWQWRDRRFAWWGGMLLILAALWQAGVIAANRFDVPLQDFRMIIYSTALILMMLLRPQGLLGGFELWPKRRGPRFEAVATQDRDDARLEPG
jgi:ABC-type branched-subunit amino acid transport system permease subunit